jgi:bis(5'-nucleosyl)-tetraphosphatase (symmetrical)
MAVYAIGDIQGCGDELEALLERVGFDPAADRLWLVGDLVNRGPRSADVLRRVRGLGEAAVTVLGNHELHLLGLASGERDPRRKDTAAAVLDEADAEELVDWLRRQPLFYRDDGLGWSMVHAAIHPDWDLAEAAVRARRVETVLRGGEGLAFAATLSSGDLPSHEPHPDRAPWDWLRFNAAVLTRTRFCTVDGEFAWGGNSPAAPRFRPWYRLAGRLSRGERIVYGHWAADGLTQTDDVLGLDTGCVWGGQLTAARLDPHGVRLWHWDCTGYWTPGQ